MAKKIILDALLPRADFLLDNAITNQSKNISEITTQNIGVLLEFLRKPDFQRETNEWDADQIVSLIESLLDDELIPSIILWKNSANYIFVIDGAHRLSALIAWMFNDYGDGEYSRIYFKNNISEDQKKIAVDTRKKVHKKFGSYLDFMDKNSKLNLDGSDEHKRRKLNLVSTALTIQWITGNAEKAEVSFEKINQQSSPLSKIERILIKERKKSHGIAARAIYWSGSGHKYWKEFDEKTQEAIENKSKEINDILFIPTLKNRIDSLNLPIGGTSLGSKDQQLILSLVKLIYKNNANANDNKGKDVVNCLTATLKVLRSLNSSHSSSVGFHAALYVYDESGVFKHGYLLGLIEFFLNIKSINSFLKVRFDFEMFIFNNKNYLQQIAAKKKGSYDLQGVEIASFLKLILDSINKKNKANEIISNIKDSFSYINTSQREISYGSTPKGKFQVHHKNNIFIRERMPKENKCPLCKGFMEGKHNSTDHIVGRKSGGNNCVSNGQTTHLFCNTTYKN